MIAVVWKSRRSYSEPVRRADPLPTPAEGLALCEFLYRDGTGLRLMGHLLPEGASASDVLKLRDRLKRAQRRPSRCMAEQDEAEG
jgi:hypothetical protein